jgi:hypothetical protein
LEGIKSAITRILTIKHPVSIIHRTNGPLSPSQQSRPITNPIRIEINCQTNALRENLGISSMDLVGILGMHFSSNRMDESSG